MIDSKPVLVILILQAMSICVSLTPSSNSSQYSIPSHAHTHTHAQLTLTLIFHHNFLRQYHSRLKNYSAFECVQNPSIFLEEYSIVLIHSIRCMQGVYRLTLK